MMKCFVCGKRKFAHFAAPICRSCWEKHVRNTRPKYKCIDCGKLFMASLESSFRSNRFFKDKGKCEKCRSEWAWEK